MKIYLKDSMHMTTLRVSVYSFAYFFVKYFYFVYLLFVCLYVCVFVCVVVHVWDTEDNTMQLAFFLH